MHRTLFVAFALLAACDTASPVDAPALDAPSVDAPSVDAPSADASARLMDLRGVRYCEVLVVFVNAGMVEAQVWGTQGISECPAADWATVDAEAVRTELGAFRVVLNGPRYWVLDTIEAFRVPGATRRMFGTLEMNQLATIQVDPATMSSEPYTERVVNRDTLFTFDAGQPVYVLSSPTGAEYVMQSYSQIVDPALTDADLSTLGSRLTLPTGWTYEVRTPDATLEVRATGEAVVLQDELQNTYQRMGG